MDDQKFDQKSALDWIATIESEKARARENDLYLHLRNWVDRTSPREILEIGCGQGVCSDQFDLSGRSYTGIDPSSFLIDRAKHLYTCQNRSFVTGNAYELPFSEKKFDAIFSVAVWHLLSDLSQAATELSRVLKDDGHFLIMTANPDAYSMWTAQYQGSKLSGQRFEGTIRFPDGSESNDVLYLHTPDELLDSFRRARLKVLETTSFRNLISIQGEKI